MQPLFDPAGLPRVFERGGEAALHALGAREDLVRETCAALAKLTRQHGEDETAADGVARVLGLTIAAVHAAARFSASADAPPEHEPITPREWLLVAARERSRTPLHRDLGAALDRSLRAMDEALTTPARALVPGDSPALDYGLGALLPALLARHGDTSAAHAGRALGQLLRLACEARAIGSRGPDAPLPQLLGRIADDASPGGHFALALAHALKPAPERRRLLQWLGDATLAARLTAVQGDLVDAVSRATAPDDDLAALARTLGAQTLRAAAGARLFGMMSRPDGRRAELERTIAMARDALLADPEIREAWEFQRWGGYFEETRVARFFPVGLCTLALHAAGAEVADRIAALLALAEPDGFRYFERFTRIPPDVDDLGLALELASRLPEPAAALRALAWPVALCLQNTDADGTLGVWLDRGLREPILEGAPSWLGRRCVAAEARALVGLAEAGLPLPEGYLDRAIASIARRWAQEGPGASYFYAAPYARFMLARLARAVERVPGDPAPRALLRAQVDAIEDALAASLGVDGGYGDELSTAAHLAVLALGRRRGFDPWPTVAFLASRQGGDGLFSWAPLYVTPGKDNALARHGARALTTAVCLEALVSTRERLTRETP